MSGHADPDSSTLLTPVKIFCSYRRADNDNIFKNTVSHLIEDMKSLHEAETGRTLEIFFDRDDLGWGTNFRDAIDQAVHEATFFMPIVTARYLDSEWCRYEFLTFYSKSRALRVTELILPIVLAGVSLIQTDSPDKIAATIADIQYSDWSNLWQEGNESAAWRTNLTELVHRIVNLRAYVETQLAEQALSDSHLESITKRSLATREALTQEDNSIIGQLRTRASRALDDAEHMVAEITDFLTSLEDAVHAVSTQSRSEQTRLVSDYIARAHSIERKASDMFDDALDFDVTIRTQRAGVDLTIDRRQLDEIIDLIQARSVKIDERINALVFAPTLVRRLDGTLGLRPIVSPVKMIMQTVRDLQQFVYGWTTLER